MIYSFYKLIQYLHIGFWILFCLLIVNDFWIQFCLGNVDPILMSICILLWNSKIPEKYKGFFFGILTFKGIIAVLIPLMIWHENKKKDWIMGCLFGILLNYFWFIFPYFSILPDFLYHIQLKNHAYGPRYLLPDHYIWFWAIIILFGQDFVLKTLQKIQEFKKAKAIEEIIS